MHKDSFVFYQLVQFLDRNHFNYLVRKYDGEGAAYEDLKPVVIKQILKRKVKITTKKVKKLFK